jgi:hypothetical protein
VGLIFGLLGDDDGGDEEEGGEPREEKVPSCGDYVMHFLTIFWKIIFAFVPPTGKTIQLSSASYESRDPTMQTNHTWN